MEHRRDLVPFSTVGREDGESCARGKRWLLVYVEGLVFGFSIDEKESPPALGYTVVSSLKADSRSSIKAYSSVGGHGYGVRGLTSSQRNLQK